MSKNTKPKVTTEAELLELLKKVLPKATHDPQLADTIYEAIEQELKLKAQATAFEKFCRRVELPDLEPPTIQGVKQQFADSFSEGDITIKPNKKSQTLAVEVALPDGSQLSSEIKVRPVAAPESEEPDVKLRYVPFPVCLPGDKELVWFLAKQENLTPEEAGIAVAKIEEEFWASKTGQKLLRERVDRTFAEFIARAPAAMLSEAGLKRHYKEPEPVKILRRSPGA